MKNFYLQDIYSKETLIKFLESKNFSGIGKETAKKLVNFFGEKIYLILKNENWIELKNSKLLPIKTIENLIIKWNKTKIFFELHLLLYKHGLSTSSIKRLYNFYKNETLEVIKNNPYTTMEKIGIGFKIADKFSKELGLSSTDERRLNAAFFQIIKENKNFGNTYLEKENCISSIYNLLNFEVNNELINNLIINLEKKNEIFILKNDFSELIFLPHDLYCEQFIKAFFKKNAFIKKEKINYFFTKDFLDEYQKKALNICFENKISLICGGAGTGKTTIMKNFYEIAKNNNLTVSFCAPTGRAAQRIKESVGIEAKTIHRTIGYKRLYFSSIKKLNYEEIIKSDFLVIDESSMIDIYTMYGILNSISKNTNLIFVGDPNQLPSINCGNILHDLLSKNFSPNIILKKIFRQNEENKIIINSKEISEGIIPKIESNSSDLNFLYEKEKEIGLKLIENLTNENYDEEKKIPNFQLLTHMNKGFFGTINLNKIIQKICAEKRKLNKTIINNWLIFDRVIQTKNNYSLEVFNGEIGQIIDGDFKSCTVKFDDKIIKYENNDLFDLSLAYAITIHKSQGSEFEKIILPIYMEQYINFSRNSLYTGITRAKKSCTIIGDYKAFALAIKKENLKRKTYLSLNF